MVQREGVNLEMCGNHYFSRRIAKLRVFGYRTLMEFHMHIYEVGATRERW